MYTHSLHVNDNVMPTGSEASHRWSSLESVQNLAQPRFHEILWCCAHVHLVRIKLESSGRRICDPRGIICISSVSLQIGRGAQLVFWLFSLARAITTIAQPTACGAHSLSLSCWFCLVAFLSLHADAALLFAHARRRQENPGMSFAFRVSILVLHKANRLTS